MGSVSGQLSRGQGSSRSTNSLHKIESGLTLPNEGVP